MVQEDPCHLLWAAFHSVPPAALHTRSAPLRLPIPHHFSLPLEVNGSKQKQHQGETQ